jgi:hypothetical protein
MAELRECLRLDLPGAGNGFDAHTLWQVGFADLGHAAPARTRSLLRDSVKGSTIPVCRNDPLGGGLPARGRRQLLPLDVIEVLTPTTLHELDDRGHDRADEGELQELAEEPAFFSAASLSSPMWLPSSLLWA